MPGLEGVDLERGPEYVRVLDQRRSLALVGPDARVLEPLREGEERSVVREGVEHASSREVELGLLLVLREPEGSLEEADVGELVVPDRPHEVLSLGRDEAGGVHGGVVVLVLEVLEREREPEHLFDGGREGAPEGASGHEGEGARDGEGGEGGGAELAASAEGVAPGGDALGDLGVERAEDGGLRVHKSREAWR